MNSLLRFIVRYQFFLLFLLLLGFSLWLLASHSYYQRAAFGNLARRVIGYTHEQMDGAQSYLRLRSMNEELVRENLALRNELAHLEVELEGADVVGFDTLSLPGYTLKKARVVNNSVNKQHNFITLNVGSNHGIKPEMGVITHQGVVGIVVGVSPNYSTAISLLNINMKVSARLQRTEYFGSFFWDGKDYRQAILSDIPQHVALAKGDTIVTSGYSAVFPPDIVLGIIESFHTRQGNFYTIRTNLTADFAKLSYVWIVVNEQKVERDKLENFLEDV